MNRPADPPWIVIMGAAVGPGGAPSGAMRRRVAGALEFARTLDAPAVFLPTGGVGRHGPAEAQVMARLLREGGAPDSWIVIEDRAQDTLASAENCAALLARVARGTPVFVVTDRYHLLRSVLLFHLYGVSVRGVRIRSARRRGRWLYACLREAVATPWDVLLALVRRGFRR